jgi:hypothetical protein
VPRHTRSSADAGPAGRSSAPPTASTAIHLVDLLTFVSFRRCLHAIDRS